jgi:hypothetical protein
MNRAFDSPTHSDLTIVVDDTRFHVHKVILGLRTPFFTNATRHGFSEANDNVVTIREHSVEAVRGFLKYCYTGDYGETQLIGGKHVWTPILGASMLQVRVYIFGIYAC